MLACTVCNGTFTDGILDLDRKIFPDQPQPRTNGRHPVEHITYASLDPADRLTKDMLTTKKIGILGGMSAASSQLYYQTLCALTQAQLGGLHSPNLLLALDFAPIADRQHEQGRLGRHCRRSEW